MNLLSEDKKDAIISGLHNVSFTGFSPKIMRAGESYLAYSGFISVDFLPKPDTFSEGLDYYLGPNGANYSWFGYGQEEMMVIRAFAKDKPYVKGKDLTYAWLNAIESYLKIKWKSLITGATLSRTPVPYRDIGNEFIVKYYGYEYSNTISYMNVWTDKPLVGADEGAPISGIEFKQVTV